MLSNPGFSALLPPTPGPFQVRTFSVHPSLPSCPPPSPFAPSRGNISVSPSRNAAITRRCGLFSAGLPARGCWHSVNVKQQLLIKGMFIQTVTFHGTPRALPRLRLACFPPQVTRSKRSRARSPAPKRRGRLGGAETSLAAGGRRRPEPSAPHLGLGFRGCPSGGKGTRASRLGPGKAKGAACGSVDSAAGGGRAALQSSLLFWEAASSIILNAQDDEL